MEGEEKKGEGKPNYTTGGGKSQLSFRNSLSAAECLLFFIKLVVNSSEKQKLILVLKFYFFSSKSYIPAPFHGTALSITVVLQKLRVSSGGLWDCYSYFIKNRKKKKNQKNSNSKNFIQKKVLRFLQTVTIPQKAILSFFHS